MASNESGDHSFIPNDEEEDVMEYKIPEMLKDLKNQYHDTVKRVYKMYSHVSQADHVLPPHLDDPTINFKESDFVACLESLDEYVDRYHPLWKVDREVCFKSLSKDNPEDGSDLAAHVNKKWGQQTIDISLNMSHIVRATPASNTSQSRRSGAGYSHLEFNNAANSDEAEEKSDIEEKYEYLCSLDIQTLKDEVLDREKVKLSRFKALQQQNQTNNRNGNGGVDNGVASHIREQMFTRDQVERLVKVEGERRGWGVGRTAQAVIGVHEIFDTKDCYNTSGEQSTIPRSHVDEILGIEDAYNMICGGNAMSTQTTK